MKLLVQSVRKFTHFPYEFIIVDNDSSDGSSEWLKEQADIRAFILNENLGHGRGLDFAIKQANYRFCLVLDIDSHLMRRQWDFDLIDIFRTNHNIRLIAAKGGEAKPIHPCFMFFPTGIIRDNGLSFVPTREYDVGRKIYPDILNMGYEAFLVSVGYEKPGVKYYEGSYGDIYYLNQRPIVYHNWYASRMWNQDRVDSFTREEFELKKKALFENPKVQRILN
jgi:glycosyltransferase involved in cell wall biosynthesis